MRFTMRALIMAGFPIGIVWGSELASAAQSTSIILRGFVPETSSLQLVSTNPVVASDLRTPVKGALVAKVLERSNAHAGYVVKLTSESGRRGSRASLVNQQDGSAIPYSLSYDGQSLQFKNGEAELKRTKRSPRGEAPERELRVFTDGSDRLPGGAYTDVLTISISAR